MVGQSVCASAPNGSSAAANAAARNLERFILFSSLNSLGDEERQDHLFVHRFEAQAHALADLEVGLGDAAQRGKLLSIEKQCGQTGRG